MEWDEGDDGRNGPEPANSNFPVKKQSRSDLGVAGIPLIVASFQRQLSLYLTNTTLARSFAMNTYVRCLVRIYDSYFREYIIIQNRLRIARHFYSLLRTKLGIEGTGHQKQKRWAALAGLIGHVN